MAQINAPKPLSASRPDDLREDGLQTAALEASATFEAYRPQIIAAVVAVVAIVVALVAFRAYRANQQEAAQLALGGILNEYTAGNFEAALDGTDTAPGLLEISEQYGATPTGQQATFFAADALYQLGRTDEAADLFAAYDGEGLLEASALAGRAAILEQAGDPAAAASLYAEAAEAYDSPATAPGYLLDAGRAHAAAGDAAAAERVFEQILADYDDAPEAIAAQTELGRVQAAASAQ